MSRIGKQPIPVADGVEVRLSDGEISIKGPKGDLSHRSHLAMTVEWTTLPEKSASPARTIRQNLVRCTGSLAR